CRRDDTFYLPRDEAERVLPHSLGTTTLDLRAQDHHSRSDRLFVTCLVYECGHLTDELAHPVTGDRGDAQTRPVGNGDVGLGADDHTRALQQLRLILVELLQEDALLLVGRPLLRSRAVHPDRQY